MSFEQAHFHMKFFYKTRASEQIHLEARSDSSTDSELSLLTFGPTVHSCNSPYGTLMNHLEKKKLQKKNTVKDD